ncbi:uncharacterized protein N7483_009536 [Penicillium malachiteum]|uniref:uncharacterized protein n=1 Tax=Penicillium malachiteum TaxID=1324776 RepID=UPI0025494F15|nr:uncharacterized protein N7483_009536 [Penicillium malachiteum]KAJ5721602.1 hypothetical protein N7483_009536 [Penicillium malachiteum]
MSAPWDLTAESLKHLQIFDSQENSKQHTASTGYSAEEVTTAPIFSLSAHLSLSATARTDNKNNKTNSNHPIFPQYGVLGSQLKGRTERASQAGLIYTNISAPWSGFICGSQGSGKSHSLSCILENALIKSSPAGKLSSPLAGLVLHYDKFTSFASTQLCEAAYLCSAGIPVRVLVSPTNFMAMKEMYLKMPGVRGKTKVTVEPMYLPKKDLNIAMMKTLMGMNDKTSQPLYMDVVMKILREMAITNQGRTTFDYQQFKKLLGKQDFIKGQAVPLSMRLAVLESFLEKDSPKKGAMPVEKMWKFEKGTLTIIDLSCPFVDPDDACALFNIAISLFLKERQNAGRIFALDEAHKFLGAKSSEAAELNDTLLSIVRQQRHLATRVIIATQEPTVSPQFLDLCNFTLIHRFNSPAWFQAIRSHLAGASGDKVTDAQAFENDLFRRIVNLKTGQALLFCPTGMFVTKETGDRVAEGGKNWKEGGKNQVSEWWGDSGEAAKRDWPPLYYEDYGSASSDDLELESLLSEDHRVVKLGANFVHLQIRNRITVDGGRSIIAQ